MSPNASNLDGGILVDYLQYFKELKKTDKVLYWRHGKGDKKWWYNGMVSDVVEVTFPTGVQKKIVGIN